MGEDGRAAAASGVAPETPRALGVDGVKPLRAEKASGGVRDFCVWVELPLGTMLHGQGIMVLLVNLIKAAARRDDVRVVIGCASWTEQPLMDVLEEYGVSGVEVVVVTGRKRPSLSIRFVARLLGRRQGKQRGRGSRRFALPSHWARRRASRGIARLLTGDLHWIVLLTPVAVLLSVMAGIGLAIARVSRVVVGWVRRVADRVTAWLRRLLVSRIVVFAQEVYRHLHVDEHMRAARQGDELGVPVWLVTSPASEVAAKLETPVVFAVADLVPIDFPYGFSRVDGGAWARRIMENVRSGVENSRATISYSEYVRNEHVVRCLGVPPSRAHVVRHATPDTDDPAIRDGTLEGDERLLTEYLQSAPAMRSWSTEVTGGLVQHLPLARTPYLLVSSQIRPHKNVMNMVRAFEILLRTHGKSCKLVLTGDLRPEQEIREYIVSRGLEFDVLSLPSVPHAAHVAMYRRSALTVVPTLFEGGFPFCFAEGMAVGTPAVMSRIPVSREIVPSYLDGVMLFDPYDPEDIAAKTLWGLEHRAELYNAQLPLYEQLSERTWDVLVDEYLGVMEAAAGAGHG